MRRLRQSFKYTHSIESLLSAKELPLVHIIEDSHWCTCIFSKKLPENLPPATLGFGGFRFAPTGILILSFIDDQRIKSWLKLVTTRDITHQTRNHFPEVEVTLCRAGGFIPLQSCSFQKLASQAPPSYEQ